MLYLVSLLRFLNLRQNEDHWRERHQLDLGSPLVSVDRSGEYPLTRHLDTITEV